ncbi:MAG: glycosyltransferase family 39 protein [Nanoarchaeota archaeon]|nr:glycosyltransferase family 39 protein [Nanoarchaeota archaeon]
MDKKEVEKKGGNSINKLIDFIFSKDNRKYVLLLFIAAFILRFLISLRIRFYADELQFITQSIGFIDSGKLQTLNQDGVWYFLTNIFMNIFGVNVLGARFLSILLGAFSVILIYLIAKEIFDEKIALIASIILAFSSYHTLNSIGAMDLPMAFFVFLSMYFLILFLKTDKQKFFLLAWVSLGFAIMIKQIAVLFIPGFILFLIYHNKKFYAKFRFKQVVYAALLISLMIAPIFTFNYLLYKDKKLVDLQFSRFFNIAKEQYASIANTLNPFSLKTLFISFAEGPPGFFVALTFFYQFESIVILLLSILGGFILAKSQNKFKWLLALSFLIPFLFLAGTSLLPNHFIFSSLFFALFSANSVNWLSNRFDVKNRKKIIIFIILLVIISSFAQIYQETHGFFGKEEMGKLIDFKDKSMEKGSLVIADSRIYRGKIAFMLWDRHYLETNFFPDLFNQLDKFPGEYAPIKFYCIEAITDDSGWGTVKNQPEFNQTTEQIISLCKEQAQLIKTINDAKGEPHFAVYQGYVNFKSSALDFVDSTHEFFFYPLEYTPADRVFDNYETYTTFDSLLDNFAHLILYAEIILFFLLLLFLLYMFYKQ